MESFAVLAYLVAAVCFIMALRGLSSPETSRAGNIYGIAGMVGRNRHHIDAGARSSATGWIIIGIVIGGAIGTFIALRIQMTALPQLVAAFHSLVGLAAVLVAVAAFYTPHAYGIGQRRRYRQVGSLIEMAHGHGDRRHHVYRLDRRVREATGACVRQTAGQFPGQHFLNLGIAVVVVLIWLSGCAPRNLAWPSVSADHRRACARLPADLADRRRRHAGRDFDAQQLFRLGSLRHRLHLAKQFADHHRRPGRFVRRDPQLHHVQGHEPLDLQRDPRRFRRRDGRHRGEQIGDRTVKQGSAEDASFIMGNAKA